MALIRGESSNPNEPAVHGKSTAQNQGMGVMGEATRGAGVIGVSTEWLGVYGESSNAEGVRGISKNKNHAGVVGKNDVGGAGVIGDGNPGPGVIGKSTKWIGVYGEAVGTDNGPAGVWGEHKNGGIGVKGVSEASSGIGVFGRGGRLAGLFEGDVQVTGKINPGQIDCSGDIAAKGNLTVDKDIFLTNADCAEDFNIGLETLVEPGTLMVLGEEGALFPSQHAYDKRAVGVISGAGNYKPGIVLDKQASERNRQPIALLGKVYCKVDAQYGAIEVGDLLMTSPTPGHAMKADDPVKALGAMIGKALRPLKEGQGLIPILIALQ